MSVFQVPEDSQSASTPIFFDPEGDVLTTNHLNAFVDEGRPMLNNYFRHVQVGFGQHGDVYLCHRVNVCLPIGHPERRIPVVRLCLKPFFNHLTKLINCPNINKTKRP